MPNTNCYNITLSHANPFGGNRIWSDDTFKYKISHTKEGYCYNIALSHANPFGGNRI